jgi:hypothetical protein
MAGLPEGAELASDEAERNQSAALAEFTALRAEILARQGYQHTMMALNLTISGALFSFALTQPSRLLALLVVPFVSFMIGGRFIAQDYGIEEIGSYIQEYLSKRVAGGLEWEKFVRTNRIINRRRIYFGLDPLFIAFPGIAAAALAFCARPIIISLKNPAAQGILELIAWVIGLLLVAVSVRNVWLTRCHFILADWSRTSRRSITQEKPSLTREKPTAPPGPKG